MFENYKDSLLNDKIILRSQQAFRSDHHRVYTEKVNKIALSSNDDKRLQTYDKVTTYPYGTPAIKVCESEMLSKNKLNRLDEDKSIPKDKDNDKYVYATKDKAIPKTITEHIDKNKNKKKKIKLLSHGKSKHNKENGDRRTR